MGTEMKVEFLFRINKNFWRSYFGNVSIFSTVAADEGVILVVVVLMVLTWMSVVFINVVIGVIFQAWFL